MSNPTRPTAPAEGAPADEERVATRSSMPGSGAAVTGEHVVALESRRIALTSRRARLRWYAAAVLCAVLGGVAIVLARKATGVNYAFLGGFAAAPLIVGGWGPLLVAGWGSYLFAAAVRPEVLGTPDDVARFAAGIVQLGIAAALAGLLRRRRIEALARELRLAQALRDSEELHAARERADAQQAADRAVAERELRARDQRLLEITATVPGVVYQQLRSADDVGRFLFVSARARDLFGLEPDEIMRDVSVAWNLVHPDDVAAVQASSDRSLVTLEDWSHEFRVRDPHHPGQWRWVHGSAKAQPGPDAGTVLFTGIFTDVTERRVLENDLRQAQRIESIGRLAGGVAHDFNNVLTAILGEVSLLASEAPPGGEMAAGLLRIRTAAESGASLSRQLLGFARRHVMSPVVVNASELLERVVPLLRRLLREQIRLEWQVTPDAGAVRVDPGLFDQVLMNLAANARDAMPGGGVVRITVSRVRTDEARRTMYSAVAGGDVVEFVVEDNGTGMHGDVLGRAFEPFFTTKEVGEGSGLGLATSHGIVAQAGGMMLLESKPGQGTVVRIALPAATEAASPLPVTRAPLRGGSEQVLVVDDDEQVRRVTAETLRRYGYQVRESKSGIEALQVAREATPPVALLVSDVVMPEMSGVELVAAMHEEGIRPVVLFVSGYPEGTITRHGVIPDGIDLLAKPYAVADLVRRVREVLDGAAS
jgi:PAS domain S-box-containing protein